VTRRATDQELTKSASWQSFFGVRNKKARVAKPVPERHLSSKAGDRIRTDDVQLGNHPLTFSEKLGKPLFTAV